MQCPVCVVHSLVGGVVLAAMATGDVMVYNTVKKTRAFLQLDTNCSKETGTHSEIVAMTSTESPPFLLIGFSCGRLHVYSGLAVLDGLISEDTHHCSRLPQVSEASFSLRSLLSLHTLTSHDGGGGGGEGVLSVWCGTSASTIIVLDYPVSLSAAATNSWGLHGDGIRRISMIDLGSEDDANQEFTAKEMKLSHDRRNAVAVLHRSGSQCSTLALLDVSNKSLLHIISCDMSSESEFCL